MSESQSLAPRDHGAAFIPLADATPGPSPDTTREQFGSQPIAGAEAARAAASFAANRMLAEQIRNAHMLGELARAQSNMLGELANGTLPSGPFRDAVVAIARVEAAMADAIMSAAGRFGREFGHLAFAYPTH